MGLDVRHVDSIETVNRNQWNNVVDQSDLSCVYHRYEWLRAVGGTPSRAKTPRRLETREPDRRLPELRHRPRADQPAEFDQARLRWAGHDDRRGGGTRVAPRRRRGLCTGGSSSTRSGRTTRTTSAITNCSRPRGTDRRSSPADSRWISRVAGRRCSPRWTENAGGDQTRPRLRLRGRRGGSRRANTRGVLPRLRGGGRPRRPADASAILFRELHEFDDRIVVFSLRVDGGTQGRYMYLLDDEQSTLQHLFTAVTEDHFEYHARSCSTNTRSSGESRRATTPTNCADRRRISETASSGSRSTSGPRRSPSRLRARPPAPALPVLNAGRTISRRLES